MSLIRGKEKVKVLYLREDYNIVPAVFGVEKKASDVFTKKDNEVSTNSWLLAHELMKPCYNIPGIPNGKKVMLVCTRDVRFDPLKQLDDSWSDDKIRKRMGQTAKEQAHKAEMKKVSSTMNATMILLSVAAVILFTAIALVSALNYYKG